MRDLNSRLYRDTGDVCGKSESSPAKSLYRMNRAEADKLPDERTCACGVSCASNAWNVNFSNGNVNNNNKNNTNYVRCVHFLNAKNILENKSIYNAYVDCRRRKRGTANEQEFERKIASNLVTLTKELQSGKYSPGKSICFVVRNPKPREVFAADFRDRIVHHLIVRRLEPYWERVFICDSYACRKGKGTLAAVDRIAHNVRSITENGRKRAYFLQLDVANFFMSINRDILWGLLEKGLEKQFRSNPEEKENIRKILRILVFHNPTESYIDKAKPYEWDLVPPNKSLFHCGRNVGLPIGNLTSQFFANVYLNELDQFVKHVLKAKYYVRYVDDFVIMHERKEQLSEWYEIIKKFLADRLNLRLKKAVKLAGISTGINFLGYVQHVHYRLVRRRVINNFKKKLEKWARKEKAGRFGWSELCDIRSLFNSYLSHSAKANAHRIFNKVLKDNKWIFKYFDFRGCKVVLKPEFKAEREKQIWDFIKGGQNGEIY